MAVPCRFLSFNMLQENDKCLVLCLDICKRDVAYSKENAKQILKTLQDYKEKEKEL